MKSFENWTQEDVETTFGIEELAFNSSDEAIFRIFSILKKSKLLVESFCK